MAVDARTGNAAIAPVKWRQTIGRRGLTNSEQLRALAFATPGAIFIFSQCGASIPIELDEAARIDGVCSPQFVFKIYRPQMALALVAFGITALLLSAGAKQKLPVGLGKVRNSREAPWTYPMAAAIVCDIPPIAICFALRRKTSGAMPMVGVKG